MAVVSEVIVSVVREEGLQHRCWLEAVYDIGLNTGQTQSWLLQMRMSARDTCVLHFDDVAEQFCTCGNRSSYMQLLPSWLTRQQKS